MIFREYLILNKNKSYIGRYLGISKVIKVKMNIITMSFFTTYVTI